MGQRYRHEAFESATERGKFTKICNDMMLTPAWEGLNLRQQGLYLHLKSKYAAKKASGRLVSDNRDNISCPRSEWSRFYGDYRTFKADMDKLAQRGFIKLVQSGNTNRTCNLYGFSDEWKQYG